MLGAKELMAAIFPVKTEELVVVVEEKTAAKYIETAKYEGLQDSIYFVGIVAAKPIIDNQDIF